MNFLGGNTPGDWALAYFLGPMANETRAWINTLATGNPTGHTTSEQMGVNFETTIAIVRAMESGRTVRLPLET